MYSVVLMVALTTGGEAPAAHHGCHATSTCCGKHVRHHGCHVANGCHIPNGCHNGTSHVAHSCHKATCHRAHGCHRATCHVANGCHKATCHAAPSCHGTAAPAPAKKEGEKAPPPKPLEPRKTAISAPATITVSLAADAKLMVDDTVTTSTSSLRSFASPELQAGKTFTYVLKGEIVRNGRTLTATQNVSVRAGEESRVEMTFPAELVAQK